MDLVTIPDRWFTIKERRKFQNVNLSVYMNDITFEEIQKGVIFDDGYIKFVVKLFLLESLKLISRLMIHLLFVWYQRWVGEK